MPPFCFWAKKKPQAFCESLRLCRLLDIQFFCVSALHINYHRNGDVIFNAFIAEFIALAIEHNMTRKQRKTDDFH